MGEDTERGIEEIVAILCDSEVFSDDEISLIEDYFEDGDDGTLGKLAYKEDYMESAWREAVREELRWLIQRGMYEAAGKVCRVIFTVWESGMSSCCPQEMFSDRCSVPGLEPAVKTALYASNICVDGARLSKPYLNKLMDYAQNNPEIIKKAYGYRGRGTLSGIVLLAMYFLLKYPEILPEDKAGGLEGLLEKQGITGDEAEQDLALMRQYEDLLLEIFGEIYFYERPENETDEIEKAIREDRVDGEILNQAVAKVPERSVKKYLDDDGKCQVGGMAFINYPLSGCLKNIISVCFAARTDEMLYAVSRMDMRGIFEDRGMNFDRIFGLDSYWLIRCAAVMRKEKILEEQFGRNREIYLKCMDDLNLTLYHSMSEVIRQTDPEFHKEREQAELARQQELVIDALTCIVDKKFGKEMKKYLSGKARLESLYASCEGVWHGRESWHWTALGLYRKFYGHDAFCRKCEAALMMCGGFENFDYLLQDGELDVEGIRELYRAMDEMGLALRFQLKGYADMYYARNGKGKCMASFLAAGREIFGAYFKDRQEEMQDAFIKAGTPGKLIMLQILSQGLEDEREQEQNSAMEQILSFCREPSKIVQNALVDILCRAKGREEAVMDMLSSQVPEERRVAVRVLSRWRDDKYVLALKEAFRREKSAELRALLAAVLPVDRLIELEGDRGVQEIIKELHKGNKKRTLAWTCETPFSRVCKKDGKEADEEYLQAILLAYAAMAPHGELVPYGVSATAEALAGQLNEEEYAVYVNELLDKWIAAGADTKKRWVLFAAANHGGADMSGRLLEAVQEWARKRAPIAVEAVRALSLSRQSGALLMVEELSRKSKVNKIREASRKALDTTASWLGITREELMDGTLPDLGFDGKRERSFDYGERKFTVDVDSDFALRVFDGNGKQIKNLPAPGKRDDEAKAGAAYEAFKLLKKQIKMVAQSQGERLETALQNGRIWNTDSWKSYFMGNPVTYRLAMGLIWGLYEDRRLAAAFCYREDGTFCMELPVEEPSGGEGPMTEEEAFAADGGACEDREHAAGGGACEDGEYVAGGRVSADGEPYMDKKVLIREVPSLEDLIQLARECGVSESAGIGLVHPLELSPASLEAWKEHLEAWGLVQPIEQLDRPVYQVTEEESGQKDLNRFKGMILERRAFIKELRALGWSTDLGEEMFCKENPELSIGAELGLTERQDYYEPEEVQLYEVNFYDLSSREDYDYEYYLLRDVPKRYFSEIVLELTRATED